MDHDDDLAGREIRALNRSRALSTALLVVGAAGVVVGLALLAAVPLVGAARVMAPKVAQLELYDLGERLADLADRVRGDDPAVSSYQMMLADRAASRGVWLPTVDDARAVAAAVEVALDPSASALEVDEAPAVAEAPKRPRRTVSPILTRPVEGDGELASPGGSGRRLERPEDDAVADAPADEPGRKRRKD